MTPLPRLDHRQKSKYRKLKVVQSVAALCGAWTHGCTPASSREAATSNSLYSNLSLQYTLKPAPADTPPAGDTGGSNASSGSEPTPLPTLKYCIDIREKISDKSENYNCNFFELERFGEKLQIQERVWNAPESNPDGGRGFPATCSFEPDAEGTLFRCSYSANNQVYPCSSYPSALTPEGATGNDSIESLTTVEKAAAGEGFATRARELSGQKSAAGSAFPQVVDTSLSPSKTLSSPAAASESTGCAAVFSPALEGHQLVSSTREVLQTGELPSSRSQEEKTRKTWTFVYTETGNTAIKTSESQSRDLDEGTEKCSMRGTLGPIEITVGALEGSDEPGTSFDGTHHITGPLLSAKQSDTDICINYIRQNPSSSTYLFKNHWKLK